jgi:uncharacterized membrane protein YgcG
MKIIKTLLGIIFSLGISISSSAAFNIPTHDGFVTDLGNVLNTQEEQDLETFIQQTEDSTTAEIAVLTIPSTDGMDISQYATEVGQGWGVGKADRDNGIMIVIAVEDRAFFIATGYGVEGILPDIRVKQIGEANFPVYFRKGDYFSGIKTALVDIDGFLRQDESIISQYNGSTRNISSTSSSEKINAIFWISIFLLCFLGLPVFIIYKVNKWEKKHFPEHHRFLSVSKKKKSKKTWKEKFKLFLKQIGILILFFSGTIILIALDLLMFIFIIPVILLVLSVARPKIQKIKEKKKKQKKAGVISVLITIVIILLFSLVGLIWQSIVMGILFGGFSFWGLITKKDWIPKVPKGGGSSGGWGSGSSGGSSWGGGSFGGGSSSGGSFGGGSFGGGGGGGRW